MKKLLLILMIAFFMFSTCISAGACDGSEGCPPASNYKNTEESYIHNDSDQEVTHVDETYSKILQIYTVQVFMANPFGLCSGVVLGFSDTNTFILTCKHCVSVNEEVYVENKLVKGIITSADDDLAILIVDGILEDKHAVTLAKEKAKVDDIIFLIGYPNLDGSVWISKGQVLRYVKDWGLDKLNSIGGTSGGGLFNERMELIGTHWGSFNGQNISLFEPVSDIKRFLKTISTLLW